MPGVGATVNVGPGTGAAELTPRLPISIEPKGTPVRGAPPGVVGDVGFEDAATLFEPEPHIPDIPDVSIVPDELCAIPEVIDIPEVAGIPDDADVPPDVAPVAGIEFATDMPPPSYVALEPYIWDDEVPNVEHGMPLEGVAIVPVGLGGRGLNPPDVISVEPSEIPVGETDEPVDELPSGEVAPIDGVGMTIPLTCASARLPMSSAGRAAAIKKNRIYSLHFMPNEQGQDLRKLVFAAANEFSVPPPQTCVVHGQTISGRLTTTGVGELRTTTHRNASRFDGLISICGT